MPRVPELPPPPENPERSPPVLIPGERAFLLEGIVGEPSLEALARIPEHAKRAVVLCHPHPLYGGSMHSAVPLAIAKVLAEKFGDSVATLRFNYRGVGASEGSYGEGRGETFDVRAAIRWMKSEVPNVPLIVCGYSFGTWVGLRASAMERGIERVALVAPAVRVFEFVKDDAESLQVPIAVYVGDNDDFCDVSEAEELASLIGASLEVFPESDHYFLRSRRKLAEAVVKFLVPAMFLALLLVGCVVNEPSDVPCGPSDAGAVDTGTSEASVNGKCADVSDCAAFMGACYSDTKCESGRCSYALLPYGSVVSSVEQIKGDCRALACDGFGALVAIVDDSDPTDDENPCTKDLCVDGVPHATHPAEPNGTACGAGKVCKSGQCVTSP